MTELERRRLAVLAAGLPYLVAELDGRVVGYSYATAYRTAPPTASRSRTRSTSPDCARAARRPRPAGRADRALRARTVAADDRDHRRQRQSGRRSSSIAARLRPGRHARRGRLQARALDRLGADAAPARRRGRLPARGWANPLSAPPAIQRRTIAALGASQLICWGISYYLIAPIRPVHRRGAGLVGGRGARRVLRGARRDGPELGADRSAHRSARRPAGHGGRLPGHRARLRDARPRPRPVALRHGLAGPRPGHAHDPVRRRVRRAGPHGRDGRAPADGADHAARRAGLDGVLAGRPRSGRRARLARRAAWPTLASRW